jgi:hypothetical protein
MMPTPTPLADPKRIVGAEAGADDDGDDGDDDEGWQDMPIVREDDPNLALDDEDRQRYRYVAPRSSGPEVGAGPSGNATGSLLDVDERGREWRSKQAMDEREYTRLRLDEDEAAEELHLRTKYLFDEDKAMTPLSQMQQTKTMLSEAQRIAYVGLCFLATRAMSDALSHTRSPALKEAAAALDLWALKIMGRVYFHMELATQGALPAGTPLSVLRSPFTPFLQSKR